MYTPVSAMTLIVSLVFLTTMPSIFEGVYQQRVGIAGLHYIALGVGLTGASQINARFMDKIYIALKKRNGGKGAPEFRLRTFYFPPVSLGMLTVALPSSSNGPRHDLAPNRVISDWMDRESEHSLDRSRHCSSLRIFAKNLSADGALDRVSHWLVRALF